MKLLIQLHLLTVANDMQDEHPDLADVLRTYANEGQFPHNHAGVSRSPPEQDTAWEGHGLPRTAPVFVDEHGTDCAVGHLMRVTGHGALADRIAAEGNNRYIEEIDDPEVVEWSQRVGLNPGDLGRIQPSYQFNYPSRRSRVALDLRRSAVEGEIRPEWFVLALQACQSREHGRFWIDAHCDSAGCRVDLLARRPERFSKLARCVQRTRVLGRQTPGRVRGARVNGGGPGARFPGQDYDTGAGRGTASSPAPLDPELLRQMRRRPLVRPALPVVQAAPERSPRPAEPTVRTPVARRAWMDQPTRAVALQGGTIAFGTHDGSLWRCTDTCEETPTGLGPVEGLVWGSELVSVHPRHVRGDGWVLRRNGATVVAVEHGFILHTRAPVNRLEWIEKGRVVASKRFPSDPESELHSDTTTAWFRQNGSWHGLGTDVSIPAEGPGVGIGGFGLVHVRGDQLWSLQRDGTSEPIADLPKDQRSAIDLLRNAPFCLGPAGQTGDRVPVEETELRGVLEHDGQGGLLFTTTLGEPVPLPAPWLPTLQTEPSDRQ